MRMNYYKIIISLIFVTFLVTGCAQPGKKVKGFKHNTPLIKTDVKEFGKSELLDYKELENLGYNIVIYPVTTQRLAMKSVEEGLKKIFEEGHQKNLIDKMQTRSRLYDLVDYEKYNALDKKIYNFSTDGHD